MTRKVFAYLTRIQEGEPQLLVFRKVKSPQEGLQVPGGTVEFDEREEEALYRQIEEESGLVHLRFLSKLDEHVLYRGSRSNSEKRFFFHVESLEQPPHRWLHTVDSYSHDDGELLEYFWIPLCKATGMLAREQDRSLHTLAGYGRRRQAG